MLVPDLQCASSGGRRDVFFVLCRCRGLGRPSCTLPLQRTRGDRLDRLQLNEEDNLVSSLYLIVDDLDDHPLLVRSAKVEANGPDYDWPPPPSLQC